MSGSACTTAQAMQTLQRRASEMISALAASSCACTFVSNTLGVLMARALDCSCLQQQRSLLLLAIP